MVAATTASPSALACLSAALEQTGGAWEISCKFLLGSISLRLGPLACVMPFLLEQKVSASRWDLRLAEDVTSSHHRSGITSFSKKSIRNPFCMSDAKPVQETRSQTCGWELPKRFMRGWFETPREPGSYQMETLPVRARRCYARRKSVWHAPREPPARNGRCAADRHPS